MNDGRFLHHVRVSRGDTLRYRIHHWQWNRLGRNVCVMRCLNEAPLEFFIATSFDIVSLDLSNTEAQGHTTVLAPQAIVFGVSHVLGRMSDALRGHCPLPSPLGLRIQGAQGPGVKRSTPMPV